MSSLSRMNPLLAKILVIVLLTIILLLPLCGGDGHRQHWVASIGYLHSSDVQGRPACFGLDLE